ncbi:unnamed protein product [Cuscuta epithymum]|uniref:Uncharacterized protein n=1 Tax=Cuscuta epithymum TaxID=186058 RepID=A0AAV0C5N9_9ASTE|nr:unnamed protein product [Cuscuta epithymum]
MAISLKLLPSSPPAPSLPPYTKPHHHIFRLNHRCFTSISYATFKSNSSLPETVCPVPPEQQPVNEFKALSESFPFSWASGNLTDYSSRLFVTGASFALLVGLPVLWFGSVGPESDPLKPLLGAASSGLILVTLAVVRMYLGWAYIGNRLLSATVEYEETGWYDGQVWVKTPEMLARDRLLGSFSVKPVLVRLKNTFVVLATSLVLCAGLLIYGESTQRVIPSSAAQEVGDRSFLPRVYSDESAKFFEPDIFHSEPDLN